MNPSPDIRIIEEIGINERTIVSWFNKTDRSFSFGIFHISDQPNIVAKISSYCTWGYLVYVAPPIKDHAEAAEVYQLYLNDILKGDYWFEDDSNFNIPEELAYLAEIKKVDNIEQVVHTKPVFTIIKNEE